MVPFHYTPPPPPADPRYRIRHPWLGYFQSITRTQYDASPYSETWTMNRDDAPSFTIDELRASMDASGRGLLGILITGYGGLQLEKA